MKGDDFIDIKIIGTNCSNGIKLYKMVKRSIENSDINITINEVNDEKSKKRYGVQNIPGLVINEKLVSQGKVLTPREITKLLA